MLPLFIFGPVLSTVHAACLRHPGLQSSDAYPRLQTVTLQSLACLGTKTSIIASVIAFSHNLSLGAKLAQDGSPCHAPNLQKIYFIRSYLSFVAIMYVINFSYSCVLVLFKILFNIETEKQCGIGLSSLCTLQFTCQQLCHENILNLTVTTPLMCNLSRVMRQLVFGARGLKFRI